MLLNSWWDRYQQPFTRMGVKVIEPPAEEFVDVQGARNHLRADSTAGDDTLIEAQIAAARQWCEQYTARSFAAQTLELGITTWPGSRNRFGHWWPYTSVELPAGPVRGVISIKYLSAIGVYSDFDQSNWALDNYAEPAAIMLLEGAAWPTTPNAPNSILIRYRAGYDLPSDSPGELQLPPIAKQAMLLMIGHFYENRESELVSESRATALDLPTGAKALLDLMPGGRLRTGIA